MLNRREFLGASAGLAAGALLSAGDSTAKNRDPTARVDCHTHFYDPSRPQGVPWPGKDDEVLYRTVLPRHFLEQAAPLGVAKTVVVEASPWVEDNAWLLKLAADNPSIVGVVGNLAPGRPKFGEHLERFAANKIYRGIRIGHDALRTGLEQPGFLADIRRLAELELELDVNGGPATPAAVARLADKVTDLKIVVNHLANVDVDGGPAPKEWLANMQAAAKHPHVYCKVSALVEHARPKSGDKRVPRAVEFYKPVLDAIWKTFGDDRLIYGSDWPVSDRFAPYATVIGIVNDYVTARGPAATEKFFWKNAQAAYRWPTM
ncbi:MAG: amidohydrolase family protein [Deltaproteobacteria bacterium]